MKETMIIEELIDTNFSGCVSIRKNGEHILHKAFGYADLSNKIPNELDTRFPTASAGKAFVAAGILQLIEKGKLKFEDTIGSILDIDLHQIDKDITIRQLLTHTSGIPDYFDESIMEEYDELWRDYPNYKIRSSKDLLPLFIHKPMMYPKGEKFQYNNTGFVVLGLIIEKVTGELFDEYLKSAIFTPAQMFDTGYFELDRLPARCANAYIYDKVREDYYTNIYSVDVKGTGAGGAFTTVIDIEKFWDALLSYKLLSPMMTQEMLTVQSGDENEGYYGYGIWLKKEEDSSYSPYFQGCDPGVSFITCYHPNVKRTITLVSNFGCNVWKLLRNIKSREVQAETGGTDGEFI